MGKYKKGVLGSFNGKVGTVIGGKWKGISYMRSLPDMSNVKPSEAQLAHRNKFARVIKFMQPLHPIVKIGYATQVKNKSAINAAVSDTMKNAVGNDIPDYTIDFQKLQIAKGTLTAPKNPEVVLNNNQLEFSWEDNSNEGSAQGTDKALLVAYGEQLIPTWNLENFTRENTSGTLELPLGDSGTYFSCYLAFVSVDGLAVSNSIFLGTFAIP